MRILIAHNHYGRFAQGGEASVMDAEAKLLEEHGHSVMKYERTNAEVYEDGTFLQKVIAFKDVSWSQKSYLDIKQIIESFQPDIMHVHNYWMLLTPSVFAAAKDCGVRTVLTLHNYRIICPGGQLLRNGRVCDQCMSGKPYRVLYHRCYPGKSLAKSLASLILYLNSKKKNSLAASVDFYIALTGFGHDKFIASGIPGSRIFVKPNFIVDPLVAVGQPTQISKGALFVGRLSFEKGVETLVSGWNGLKYPLDVVGDGPLYYDMRRNASSSITFHGPQSHDDTLKKLNEAAFFIFPSECYEGFPLSLLEAMAMGKAIIASDLGPRREMIEDGVTGLLFEAGNSKDLRSKIDTLILDMDLRMRLGKAARAKYLALYTPETNYQMLMEVYNRAMS